MRQEKAAEQPQEAPTAVEERVADLRRRRAEAADVLADTLLDIWLGDRRAARQAEGKRGRDV